MPGGFFVLWCGAALRINLERTSFVTLTNNAHDGQTESCGAEMLAGRCSSLARRCARVCVRACVSEDIAKMLHIVCSYARPRVNVQAGGIRDGTQLASN